MKRSIFIGYDPRQETEYEVASGSARRFSSAPVAPIRLTEMQALGLYRREVERRGSQLFDPISDAPMSTEFAISRFLTPRLAGSGWALFMDSDVLVRGNLDELFDQADPDYAVMCVKHVHKPKAGVKMDGQIQTAYARKNWSSVMLFNCDHAANARLTDHMVNMAPGRDLHRFAWLDDRDIGSLSQKWNWLVGHSDPKVDPKIVHYTDGTPLMPGYENKPYADEWRAAAETRDTWTFSRNYAKSGTRSIQETRRSPSP